MLDAAADELEMPTKHPPSADDQKELENLIDDLRSLASYPDESSAKALGLEKLDSGYSTWIME